MKRFILYFLALLAAIAALALAVDWMNVFLICSSSGNSAYKMKRLYENPESDEIAIFGSSRAVANFAPSVISPRCFDYGIDGMGLNEVMELLKVIKTRKSEKPIIINIDPWGGLSGNHIVGDYRLAPQSERLSFVQGLPGLRFFGSLRANITGALEERRAVTKKIDCGARLMLGSRTPEEWKVIDAKSQVLQYGPNPAREAEFLEIIASLAPRKVICVVGPCSDRWTSRFKTQEGLKAFLVRVERLPNAQVINLFGAPEFSDADFADPTHMNIQGAHHFSKTIKPRLNFN